MTTNYISDGSTITYHNQTGGGISAGSIVTVGKIAAIADTDILDGNTGTLSTRGVFSVPKEVGQALEQGVALYYNEPNSTVDTDTINPRTPVGICYEAATEEDETVKVWLNVIVQDKYVDPNTLIATTVGEYFPTDATATIKVVVGGVEYAIPAIQVQQK